MGICALHWPEDATFEKVKGHLVPLDPPSIFPGCSSSFVRQLTQSNPRRVEERRISLTQRNEHLIDEQDRFEDADRIRSFVDFKNEVILKLSPLNLIVSLTNEAVKIFQLNNEDEINFVVNVHSSLSIEANKLNTKIKIIDLLGFNKKLSRWSQLNEVLNRCKNFELEPQEKIKYYVEKIASVNDVRADDFKLDFLLEQLELFFKSPNGRRYSYVTLMNAVKIFLSSRSAYKNLREILSLPHHKVLQSMFCKVSSMTGSHKESIKAYCNSLTGMSKYVSLIFDEIYLKPSIQINSEHLIGFSLDEPTKCAKTVLAIMLKPMFGVKPLIASLLPVYKLNSEFLFSELFDLIKFISSLNVRVINLMADNHPTNIKVFNLFQSRFPTEAPYKFTHPCFENDFIYLIFDPTHLMKNIRNNWLNEKERKIEIYLPEKQSTVLAKWTDVSNIYLQEENNIVRQTALTKLAIYPSAIERQKVQLVLQVFHDKTVSALKIAGFSDTSEFVSTFLKMWKILNNKDCFAYQRLNDVDRKPPSKENDEPLKYLKSLSACIKKSRTLHASKRHFFTSQTCSALTNSLDALAELSEWLLSLDDCKYILLGQFQSDSLEGEFGVYRSMSGGSFYINLNQLLSSARLREVQLFFEMDIDVPASQRFCDEKLQGVHYEFIDNCLAKSEEISSIECSTLFYISGFLAKRGNIPNEKHLECLSDVNEKEKMFLEEINRGRLKFPPDWLFSFVKCCYVFFKEFRSSCLHFYSEGFAQIYFFIFSDFDVENIDMVVMILAKTFAKGLMKKTSDDLIPTAELRRSKYAKFNN